MEERFIVVGFEMDGETGSVSPITSLLYTNEQLAKDAMRTMYQDELKKLELEDNNACDEDTGEAIAGGYGNEDECGIYNYVDFAFGQLLEVFYLCVKKLTVEHTNA